MRKIVVFRSFSQFYTVVCSKRVEITTSLDLATNLLQQRVSETNKIDDLRG